MRLNVEIKGNGFPILCLHGHPGSGASMAVFTNRLCQEYQTIAPDLRGYGQSRPAGSFCMSDHLSDLTALLNCLQVERCLLLGWSLGGILALEMALADPQRFSGLILIASAARPRGDHPPTSWQDLLYTGVAGILNVLNPGWQWNIDTFGRRSLFRYLLHQQSATAYRYLADGIQAYLQTSHQAHQALSTALKAGYNRLEALPELTLPCLALAGSKDCHITASSSQETAAHFQDCHWKCYPQTAHLFPWEIPEQVCSDIERWLKSRPEVVS
ncbi:MAG: alpha/beta fold hydrolase [Cyanophyceae cyanobacterium]